MEPGRNSGFFLYIFRKIFTAMQQNHAKMTLIYRCIKQNTEPAGAGQKQR